MLSPSKAQDSFTAFQGKVLLELDAPRKIDHVRAEIIGICSLAVNGKYSTWRILDVSQELPINNSDELQAGSHTFPFSLQVPSDAATFTKCQYGRISHILRITAPRCGLFGKDLIHEEPVLISANSCETGIPDPYTLERENLDDHLGPWRIQLASRYLLISGYLTLTLSIPQPTTKVILSNIVVDLVQSFELANEGGEVQQRKNAVRVWSLLNHSQGKTITIPQGKPYEFVQQMRLPRDTTVTQTTDHRTRTPIRAAHYFEITLHYRVPQPDGQADKTYLINFVSQRAIISSCCCLLETMQLPAYSRQPLDGHTLPESLDLTDIGLCYSCLCKVVDMQGLVKLYGIPPEEVTLARTMQRGIRWKEEIMELAGSPLEGQAVPAAINRIAT